MYKKIFLVLLIFISSRISSAQTFISPNILDSLQTFELRMQGLAGEMLNNKDQSTRLSCAFYLVKYFLQTFRIDESYSYPFDSLKSVSKISPPGKEFRIFTWQLVLKNGQCKQFGVIQMNPELVIKSYKKNDSYRKYFPLIDRSDSVVSAEDSICTTDRWFGALYYSIIPVKYKKKTYYTLLGFDGNDIFSKRKVIDVLWFEKGKPKLGAAIFKRTKTEKIQTRIIYEFDSKAAMGLHYIEDKKIIISEHLIPPEGGSADMKKKFIPDGSFDYFKFEKGIWQEYEMFDGSMIK